MTILLSASVLMFILSVTWTNISIGLFLTILLIHGIFVDLLGSSAIHLPVFVGISMVIGIIIKKQFYVPDNTVVLIFLSIMTWMVVTAFLGLDPKNSINSLILYFKAFALCILMSSIIRNQKQSEIVSIFYILGAVLGSFYVFYQYQTGTFTINEVNSKRAAGLRGDPNDTAMLLVASIPFLAYWWYASRQILLKLLLAFCFSMVLLGIVFTVSRAGFLGLVLVFSLILLKRPSLKGFTLVAFLAAVFLSIAPSYYWDRIETLIEGESKSGKSMSSRILLYQSSLELFGEHPAMGLGPGNFELGFVELHGDSFSLPQIANPTRTIVAHNAFLEFLVENGLPGLILLISLFCIAFNRLLIAAKIPRRSSNIQNSSNGAPTLEFFIFLAILSILFSCLFLSQGKNSVLWFLVGVALSVKRFKPD